MMHDKISVTGVLLAAGSGTRYSKSENKVYCALSGVPILSYGLRAFLSHPSVDRIIVTCRAEDRERAYEVIRNYSNENERERVTVVTGGSTRKESVYIALSHADKDGIAIVHDAARPFIRKSYIDGCLDALKEADACTVAVPAKDTIKITDDSGYVVSTTRRANTWVIQTPQCAAVKALRDGYEKYGADEHVTDDCMLIEKAGGSVKIIRGRYSNIKITTPEDIDIAEEFLRIGMEV